MINVRPFTHACDRQVTLSAAAVAAAASSSLPRGHNTAARTIVAAAQINVPTIMCRENSHTNNNESGRRRSQHDPSRDARYHHQRNETTTRKCHTHVCVTPTPRVLRAIAFTSTITTYIDDDDDTNYVPYSQTALDDRLCVSVPGYGSSLSGRLAGQVRLPGCLSAAHARQSTGHPDTLAYNVCGAVAA